MELKLRCAERISVLPGRDVIGRSTQSGQGYLSTPQKLLPVAGKAGSQDSHAEGAPDSRPHREAGEFRR